MRLKKDKQGRKKNPSYIKAKKRRYLSRTEQRDFYYENYAESFLAKSHIYTVLLQRGMDENQVLALLVDADTYDPPVHELVKPAEVEVK